MDVGAPSGERGDARSAWRAAVNNPLACWALARSQWRSMIQALFTLVVLGGCALIVGVVPFDEKLPLVFRILIVCCALVAMMCLAYVSIHQAWPCVRAWFRRREEGDRREEAVPLARQERLRAALLPPATRSHSFVFSSASPNPLPENPPPYQRVPTPPRYTSSPLRSHPASRPLFLPSPPPPFPIPPLPMGYPTRPTAPSYVPNPSITSLETAIQNCYYYDQVREPLFREYPPPPPSPLPSPSPSASASASASPSPPSPRNGVEEHSNSGSDKEDEV